ncbi:hypothetical protein PRZ48_003846 [Zasmidium cellare]|uniref:Uncharacterized protein n=1 Tax=Zasmidium cellare TaxID=395010 RepID=A0ABR0EXS4_ZASCE|nr:hypothetical protein PRZ48_003846 [Zasmidium cellare]
MAKTLLMLPAEIRNSIYELIIPPLDEPNGYTSFSKAIQQQPALLHTCRQLRSDLWPMYYSSLKLVVNLSTSEVEKFQQFLRAADERLISTLRTLSLTLPCAGHPEFSHQNRGVQPHNMLYDIERSSLGRFEVTENHGFWFKEAARLSFGARMHRTDRLGYSTCSDWDLLPVRVEHWMGGRFRKEELLALIEGLCADEELVPRLYAGSHIVREA